MSDPTSSRPTGTAIHLVSPRRRQQAVWTALGTVLAVLLILFLRRPDAFLRPQFWAEDGAIFFNYADRYGWRSLLMPYAGYHHLVLRMIAFGASRFDPLWAPTLYFAGSTLVIAAVAAALFSPRLALPHRPWLALAVVLVPQSGEVFNNLTNAQWPLALGLVLLLLTRDAETWRQWTFDLLAAAAIGLTGVFSILFAPFFVLRAVWRRSRAAWALAGVVVLAAGIQARTLTQQPSGEPPHGQAGAATTARVIGERVAGGLLLPPSLRASLPAGALAASSLAVLAALAATGWRRPGLRREQLLLWGSLAALLAAVRWKFGGDFGMLGAPHLGERYFFLPQVLLLWVCILACHRRTAQRWMALGVCALALLSTASVFRFEPYRDYDWPAWATKLRAHEAVVVPVNPAGFTFAHPGRWPEER